MENVRVVNVIVAPLLAEFGSLQRLLLPQDEVQAEGSLF